MNTKIFAVRLAVQNFFLYCYAFSISVENIQPFGTENFSLSKLVAVFYLCSILPNFKTFFNFNKNVYFYFPIVFFFIWLVFISLINMNSYSSRFFAADIFFNIIIFIMITNHARKDIMVLDKTMFAFALGAIFVSALLFFDIGRMINQDCRATFLKADPNELCLKLVTGIMVIITMFVQDPLHLGRKRFFLILFLPFMSRAVLESGSRTGYAVLLIGCFIWFFLIITNNKNTFASILKKKLSLEVLSINISIKTCQSIFINNKRSIVLVLNAVLILALIFSSLLFFESSCQLVGYGSGEFTTSKDLLEYRFSSSDSRVGFLNLGGRDVLWKGFAKIISENIIFGYGLSGFDNKTFQYFGFIESPHNVLIEILLYTGLIGLAIYLFFLYRIFFISYLLYIQIKKYMPVLLLPTIIGFTFFYQGLSEKIYWFILAYIAGIYLYNQKNENSTCH